MAELTPLHRTDSLEIFLSLLFLHFFQQFQFRRHSLTFQFTKFVDKPIPKYFGVFDLPYFFHSTNPLLRGMKELRRRGRKEFSKGLKLRNGNIRLLMA